MRSNVLQVDDVALAELELGKRRGRVGRVARPRHLVDRPEAVAERAADRAVGRIFRRGAEDQRNMGGRTQIGLLHGIGLQRSQIADIAFQGSANRAQCRQHFRIGALDIFELDDRAFAIRHAHGQFEPLSRPKLQDIQRKPLRHGIAIDGDHRAFRAIHAEREDARDVGDRHSQTDEAAGRGIILRLLLPIRGAHGAIGAGLRRIARAELGDELSVSPQPPVAQVQHHFRIKCRVLGIFDDDDAGHPVAHLLQRVAMRVIPEGAGIRRREGVVEMIARIDIGLGQEGHAVHIVRKPDAMPVNGSRIVYAVDQPRGEGFALFHPHDRWHACLAIGKHAPCDAAVDEIGFDLGRLQHARLGRGGLSGKLSGDAKPDTIGAGNG